MGSHIIFEIALHGWKFKNGVREPDSPAAEISRLCEFEWRNQGRKKQSDVSDIRENPRKHKIENPDIGDGFPDF